MEFIRACEHGKYYEAVEIYKTGIDIHADDELAFRTSCENGSFVIAKWLYSLGDIDVRAKNGYAFARSCAKGHIEIAKWIHSLDVTIYQDHEKSFFHVAGTVNLKLQNGYII